MLNYIYYKLKCTLNYVYGKLKYNAFILKYIIYLIRIPPFRYSRIIIMMVTKVTFLGYPIYSDYLNKMLW